jgi:hypothetical protein
MKDTYYGIDWGNGEPHTVIAIYGLRYGKTYLMKWWSLIYTPDLLSKQLIRRLAAEAVITISINN